jgi:predicted nucleic acid-binding protein
MFLVDTNIDAYQYIAAEQYDAPLVSFDADFDRTERGRLTPAAALNLA